LSHLRHAFFELIPAARHLARRPAAMCKHTLFYYSCGHYSEGRLDICEAGEYIDGACPDGDRYDSRTMNCLCYDCVPAPPPRVRTPPRPADPPLKPL